MITDAELAQMKAWSENYRAHADYVNDVPRLLREVEELRAALRQMLAVEFHGRGFQITDEWLLALAKARAALGGEP